MRRWGSLIALLVLAVLLLAFLPAPSKADTSIALEFPPRIESGYDYNYRVNLTNEGEVDIVVYEVVADIQGADWQFFQGYDIVHMFNGSRMVFSGESTYFEKEQYTWASTGSFDVVVTVTYMEVGGTERAVVNRSFPVIFYLEQNDSLYPEKDEPNLVAIFFFAFVCYWGVLMFAFFVRQSVFDFEIKKTLEQDPIDGLQWFKWFDQIWWARGHRAAVLILWGAFAFVFALMITLLFNW